ncbi:MBL fold metallo-hydrolase, partial [Candidatus Micrarchaeota archaeon]|nr:MBL fold metallo-hydrolase [Candidatus Micrarchaeota archaeon]
MANNVIKELQDAVETVLPKECELTKVELEGPQVVLYLRNIKAFYNDEHLITKIASKVRKKVILRCDSSVLMAEEQALAKINEFIPKEAGVDQIRFDTVFNEVVIEAMKPGLVIGKGGSVLKNILLNTGWSPKVLRTPTMPSEVIAAVRGALYKGSVERKKFLNKVGAKLFTGSTNAEWVKLTCLGAWKEVGRSCMLLQTPKSNVILDCGLNIDTSDATKAYPYLNAMGITLDQIDAVILSHAHLDHCGFIPYLYAYGYDGPVYCTPPTRDLMVLLQQDCVKVMNSETGKAPYGEKDIKKELNNVITRDYGEVTDVTSDIRFTFHNAGHMLGSAMVHLHIGEGMHNLVYTGDLKFGKTNLCDSASAYFPRVETLIMEATYGGRNDIKPRIEEADAAVIRAIRETVTNRGKVLIPVIASGRAQEIMLVLEDAFRRGMLEAKVFV